MDLVDEHCIVKGRRSAWEKLKLSDIDCIFSIFSKYYEHVITVKNKFDIPDKDPGVYVIKYNSDKRYIGSSYRLDNHLWNVLFPKCSYLQVK